MDTANQTLSYGATRHGKEADFRVWAALPNEITLRLTRVGAEPQDIPMRRDGEDFGAIAAAAAGDRYAYILEDSPPISDPVSRFLREGVHGPIGDRRSCNVPLERRWMSAEVRAPHAAGVVTVREAAFHQIAAPPQ